MKIVRCALCLAFPDANASREICSITLQKRNINKACLFAASAFGSEPSNPAILEKYGLESTCNPKATLPGSIRDRRTKFYKSLFSKTLQVAFIISASKVSDNRIRIGANIIRWAVATAILTFMRWYGRLVASSPSELFRLIGYQLVDERGFVRDQYPIIDTNGVANGEYLAVVRQTPGDGSCLFYAVAAGLLQSEAGKQSADVLDTPAAWSNIRKQADELRQMAVDTLESGCDSDCFTISEGDKVLSSDLLEAAASSFGMTAKEYCQSMRQSTCWGGGVELVALSNALNRNICMYETCRLKNGRVGLRRMVCFGPFGSSGETLHVLIADNRFPLHQEAPRSRRTHFLSVFLV
mmetsp:Transcript_9704/g.27197  ORF Transcript_9704/g.27197 Transcript_9704/m.27197 type:complete len:352 (-) Transcript_9704:75-1130(-)